MSKPNKLTQAALQQTYMSSPGLFYRRAVEELWPGRAYHHAPYVDAIFYQLARMWAGETNRLIINIPPRHYKSTIVSVVTVAMLLGIDPSLKIMVVSYSKELVVELHNLTRDLMQSDFYKCVFPATKIKIGKNTEGVFLTTKNGGRRAVSAGGSATGFGADIIIVDDLMKPEDALSETVRTKMNAYVQNTLLSRIENKRYGKMIVIQQRLHPDDTTGYLLEHGTWDHLKLSAVATTKESIPIGNGEFFEREPGDALDPEREDIETLGQLRKEVGEFTFSAQWQQEPVLPGGNMLKLEQFQRYDMLPPRHYFEYYVQSWDPAVTAAETSDYSVCTTWGKRGDYYYLIHVLRIKLEYPDLEKMVWHHLKKFDPKLVIFERSHIGSALYATYENSSLSMTLHDGPVCFACITPKVSKVERAAVQSVKVEQGRLFLPTEAEWLPALENELRQFPNGKYDDQVDSIVQFLMAMDYPIAGVNC